MLDKERPIGRAVITPGQPIKYEIISPVRHDFPGRDDTMVSGAESQAFPLRNNQFLLPCTEENKSKEWPLNDQNNPITYKPFNLDEMSKSRSAPTNFRDSLINLLASTSPEDLEKIIQFIVFLITSLTHGVPTPQSQAISANSDLKDVLGLVLKVCGRQLPSAGIDSSKSLTDNVKLVWNAIVGLRCDILQKVDLTKALQKKLKAKEIDEVLEFLISEGGVLDKVEQNKIGSSGRAPSPTYRLLRQNPKYK